MLKDEKKREILEDNYLLNKRSDARKKNRYLTAKHRYFLFSILLGLFLMGLFYFLTDISNIYRITVSGNHLLKEKDILSLSGLDTGDKYLLFSSSRAEKAIEKSPFVKNATVKKENGRLVTIEVEEEKILGYSYIDGQTVILYADDRQEVMDMDSLYMIEKIPFISGFRDEQLDYIRIGFKEVSVDTIDIISEIHRYPFSYDENMMEIIMKDGNYVFSSTFGLKMLEHYYSIISSLGLHDRNVCIYLDEVTNSGYISACPWEEPEEPEIEVGEEDYEDDD